MKRKKLPKPAPKVLSQIKANYTTIKVRLDQIIKDPSLLAPVEDVVTRVNKIVINTYQFMKLYLIHHSDSTSNSFPVINDSFIKSCMSVLTTRDTNRGRKGTDETKELRKHLKTFYDEHYEPLNHEKINASLLSHILACEATDMFKNILNNIKANFSNKLKCLINKVLKLDEYVKDIKASDFPKTEQKELIRLHREQIKKVKDDIFDCSGKELSSNKEYHDFVRDYRDKFIPKKRKDNYIPYDIKSNTITYLPHFFLIHRYFEDNDLKLFHCFPLRTEIKPHYITFETSALTDLFGEEGTKGELQGNVTKNEQIIWKNFVDLENSAFIKNHFVFDHNIKTDGVVASIRFLRQDLVGKTKSQKAKGKVKEGKEVYITDALNKEVLKKKKVVGIDPNKGDLIYCIDEDRNTFRYTANQRRFETGTKKFNKELMSSKKLAVVEGFKVIKWEKALSQHNSKTSDFDKFRLYIKVKTHVNNKLFDFYAQEKIRQNKFNIYNNTRRSEDKMVNAFRRKYGEPEEVVIAFGDHEQGEQMKYHEPTKDIGMRKLFRKHGFQVYLVKEHRTSKACNRCGHDVETFIKRKSARPWMRARGYEKREKELFEAMDAGLDYSSKMDDCLKKKGVEFKVHGLVRCTNGECNSKWNRDFNASLNILDAAVHAISNLERPDRLRRADRKDDTLSTTSHMVVANIILL